MSEAGEDEDASPRRGGWVPILVVAALVGLLAGVAWGIADAPRYTATATVIQTGKGTTPIARFVERGRSSEVARAAAALLGDDVPGADLLSDVTLSASPDGVAVVIEATSRVPDYAAAAADGFAEGLVRVTGADARQEDHAPPLGLGAQATVPSSPSENRSAVLWGLGGLAAGLLAGGFGIALTGRWRRGRDRDAVAPIEDMLGVPVTLLHGDPMPLARSADPLDTAAGAVYVELLDSLRLDDADAPRTLAILAPEDGHSSAGVAVGLAIAAAEADRSTIVVDADLGEGTLAGALAVAPAPGLREYLDEEASPREVLRSARVGAGGARRRVICVPAGDVVGDVPPLLASGRFERLVRRLPRVYDLVVFAAPPLLAGADGGAVAESVDGVVLVCPDGRTSPADVERSARLVPMASVLRVLLTRAGVS